MLSVKTPDEVMEIIKTGFGLLPGFESVGIAEALGRVSAEDIVSAEYVPGFDRSAVDGYAVCASDTFGCSESIPAILTVPSGPPGISRAASAGGGFCVYAATGAQLPPGADSVVMLEYTEDYKDGTVGIEIPVAPGNNVIFKDDDLSPGDVVLRKGCLITEHDTGALAAAGITELNVRRKPAVGIISTGDELVEADKKPNPGEVRDVNTYMLAAAVSSGGGSPKTYGIVPDDEKKLDAALGRALSECDVVLISGGSSVGAKDAAARVIGSRGEILFHGIAMKPGKPTILGKAGGKPVFGLPGHPVAAYFVTRLFVFLLLDCLTGRERPEFPVRAVISEAVPANHGRAEYAAVKLRKDGDIIRAEPVRFKSGLITSLAATDGYICVPRDCEGIAEGTAADVTLWRH